MQELKFDPDNINVSIQPTDVVYVTSLVNEQSGINTPSYPHPKPRAIGVVYDVDLEKGIIFIDDSDFPFDDLIGKCGGNCYYFFSKDRRANLSGLLGYYALVEYRNYSKKEAEIFATGTEYSPSSK